MAPFIKQIGIFILLGQTLLHFCPNEKYEKYIKVLLGFMIIVQFLSPVLSLGSGNIQKEYENNLHSFTEKLEDSLAAVNEKWLVYDKQIEEKLEQDKNYMEEQIKQQEEEEVAEAKETETQEETIKIEAVKVEVGAYE